MSELRNLLESAPPGTDKVLQAFALAEALTDQVAKRIYALVSLDGVTFSQFREAIGYSNIIEARNSEWNVADDARHEIITLSPLSIEEEKAVHSVLLSASYAGDRAKAGWETPHYLFTHAGLAFHNAALGKIDEALQHYSDSAIGGYNGDQWLAANFVQRQQSSGLIPKDAIEALFLQAMVLFRTGNHRAALPLLRKIADSDQRKREVAIALHIVANDDARHQRPKRAEAAYTRSIGLLGELNDLFGLAQTEHSLANMYAKQRRFDEAETAYKSSIKLRGVVNDLFGLAQTEHSLANMYAKQRRFDEAETAYKSSIELRGVVNDLFGLAQTEHSLANMYAKQRRFDEAETAYKSSIEVGQKIDHAHHVAQTQHSLANMYARQQRFDEAEVLYEDSIDILQKLGDKNGVAQTLRSRGLAIGLRNPKLALHYFAESLQLNESIRNNTGIRIVSETISRFRRQLDDNSK